ncbi:his operon leader peptide [Klebsiella pneumoniae]|nr:his operon leader peptide [Klebsiella pneumoniae]HCF8318472.1 his operon leader peptide [Klebsiella variicola subsp. variicola]MBF9634600.1 his operon leader peptide [Klebsiella pneumoniae]MDH8034370.1 his operon leader peptide [Klebsiella pneumoniae]HBQ2315441.1 his operon leader peptide [Klebsiella pneumoniae]HBQ3449218.1 his operon leader peptide [Klebsiella pneumoniae]
MNRVQFKHHHHHHPD